MNFDFVVAGPMGDNGLIGSKIIIYLAINMDMAFNVEDDLS